MRKQRSKDTNPLFPRMNEMYKPLPDNLRLGFYDIHDIGLFAKEGIAQGTNLGMTHLKLDLKLLEHLWVVLLIIMKTQIALKRNYVLLMKRIPNLNLTIRNGILLH